MKKSNFYVMQYPLDIDILTFDSVASDKGKRESKILLNITNFDSCTLDNLTSKIEYLLWNDVLLNDTVSYLCTRKMSHNYLRKTVLFYAFMVWVGYDLSCSYIEKNVFGKVESVKEVSPLEITFVCVILALFYPLIFSLIELEPLSMKVKKLKKVFENDQITEYNENEMPFGFHRSLLKLCYLVKIENHKDSDNNWKMSKKYTTNIAACRLATAYFCILCAFSVSRYWLSYEDHVAYDEVYRLGIPLLNSENHFVYNCIVFFSGLAFGAILLKLCYMVISRKDINVKGGTFSIKNTILSNGCFHLSIETTRNKVDREESISESSDLNQPKQGSSSESGHARSTSVDTLRDDDDPPIYCCLVSKPIEEAADTTDDTEHRFINQFVDRFVNILSYNYWSILLNDVKYCFCNCLCRNKAERRLCCFQKFICMFSMITFVILNILTSLFPFFWIILYCPYFFTKHIILILKCVNCNNVLMTLVFTLVYPFVFALFFVTQWIVLCSNIFVLRSLLYLAFVALSSSHHFLRIFIVIVITVSYVASFLYRFIKEYSIILKVIFEEKRKKCENDFVTVSQNEFDNVIDKVYKFRQRVFRICIKTLVCTCFVVIATKVLLYNRSFDDFSSDYLIKLAFIAFSPKVFFDFVEYKEEDFENSIKKHREHIKDKLDTPKEETEEIRQHQCCACNGWNTSCASFMHSCNTCCNCLQFCDKNCSCCSCPLLSTFCCFKCICNIDSFGIRDKRQNAICCFECITETRDTLLTVEYRNSESEDEKARIQYGASSYGTTNSSTNLAEALEVSKAETHPTKVREATKPAEDSKAISTATTLRESKSIEVVTKISGESKAIKSSRATTLTEESDAISSATKLTAESKAIDTATAPKLDNESEAIKTAPATKHTEESGALESEVICTTINC